jgi:hypothetical protein
VASKANEVIEFKGERKVMKLMRLVGMVLVAVAAMCFVAVSSAGAAESRNPLFVPATNQAIEGKGGESSLSTAGVAVACTENHVVSGNVANSLLIGNVVIHYLGCVYTKGEEESGCKAFSVGSPEEGLLLTKTLHAILGIELPANKTVVVFLPQAGTEFLKFAPTTRNGRKCNIETTVTGSVAALITPVGEKVKKFTVTTNRAEKVGVHLTHNLGLITTKLVAFGGETGSLVQSDEVETSVETEVT